VSKNPPHLATLIKDVGFSRAITNCLMADGIATLADLVKLTRRKVSKVPGLGRTRLDELERNLAALGLALQPKEIHGRT
jgi:DNA-directed RNA polymerase alpha subunit